MILMHLLQLVNSKMLRRSLRLKKEILVSVRHVANPYSKAAKDGGRGTQTSVTIHTSVCPECGRTYVSGGTTRTSIAYGQQPDQYEGNNVDLGP